MEPLWSPGVATGGNRRQIDRRLKPQTAKTSENRCHRLPATFHGKQGVCRGLPPVAGGPLPAKEEVDLLKTPNPANPKATGLDAATLTAMPQLVKPLRIVARSKPITREMRRGGAAAALAPVVRGRGWIYRNFRSSSLKNCEESRSKSAAFSSMRSPIWSFRTE